MIDAVVDAKVEAWLKAAFTNGMTFLFLFCLTGVPMLLGFAWCYLKLWGLIT